MSEDAPLLPDELPEIEGFRIAEAIGHGSHGIVYAALELALGRFVAIKVLRNSQGRSLAGFLREARVTSAIDHPDVTAVHGLMTTKSGQLCFIMRKLNGESLADFLTRPESKKGLTINRIVGVGIRCCQVLARAHDLGIVHRDVTPQNIIIGEHGSVTVVDWGECLTSDDVHQQDEIIGTPDYMSPEQARGERAEPRSDIYGLGATLFTLLYHRPPIKVRDQTQAWARKQKGDYDQPDVVERALVPPPLAAIINKALANHPANRYPNCKALMTDLEAFQAGQAVAAYREGIKQRVQRWLRSHREVVVATTITGTLILALAVALFYQYRLQYGGWGAPHLQQTFSDETWSTQWVPAEPESWRRVDGALRSESPLYSYLIFHEPLAPDIALEFDAWMETGSQPGDLSVAWVESNDLLDNPAQLWDGSKIRGYWLQTGAYDNASSLLYRREDGVVVDESALRLEHERRYRVRIEINGSVIRMAVDGKQVLEHQELMPLGNGFLCIYAYYPGKRFDNLVLYQREKPELVSPLTVGDAFFRQGDYTAAMHQFDQVAASHAQRSLGDMAHFRSGLAALRTGNFARAEARWSELRAPFLKDAARVLSADYEFRHGDPMVACQILRNLGGSTRDLRYQARTIWLTWVELSMKNGWATTRPALSQRLVEIHEQVLHGFTGTDRQLASLHLAMGHLSKVAENPARPLNLRVNAMQRLGQAQRALTIAGLNDLSIAGLRLEAGFLQEVLEDPRSPPWAYKAALWESGRAMELLEEEPTNPDALLILGRPQEVLAKTPWQAMRIAAAAQLGAWTEALSYTTPDPEHPYLTYAQMLAGQGAMDTQWTGDLSTIGWLLIHHHRSGEDNELHNLRDILSYRWVDWKTGLAWPVVEPLILADRDLLRQRLEEVFAKHRYALGQRLWYAAGLALGKLKETDFDNFPAANERELWRLVGRTLEAELNGNPEPIQAAWQAYQALSFHRRIVRRNLPNLSLEALAQWRSQAQQP